MSSQNEEVIGEDLDRSFLDQVLNTLYDFGDGPGKGGKESKRKKRRKADENDDGGCSPAGVVMLSAPQTREDRGGSGAQTGRVEVVTFQDPSKMKAKAAIADRKPEQTKDKDKDDPDRFNLEKARLEVHRFGITGFQKEQRRQFEQERAIMLGAKPPKKDYVNYKVYQQMVKEKKLKEKEEVKSDTKKKKPENKGREKKRKSSSSVLPTGQVGRFKNGMLVLSSKEIQRIKNSRVVK